MALFRLLLTLIAMLAAIVLCLQMRQGKRNMILLTFVVASVLTLAILSFAASL